MTEVSRRLFFSFPSEINDLNVALILRYQARPRKFLVPLVRTPGFKLTICCWTVSLMPNLTASVLRWRICRIYCGFGGDVTVRLRLRKTITLHKSLTIVI